MNKVVLYCRPGFEKECAAEITDKAAKRDVFGFARVKENAGYVVFECYQPEDADKLANQQVKGLAAMGQMFRITTLQDNTIATNLQYANGQVTLNGQKMTLEEFVGMFGMPALSVPDAPAIPQQ